MSYPEFGLMFWNLEAIAFKERPRKTRVSRGKPLRETARINNQLDPQITSPQGLKPSPKWWNVSDVSNTTSLLPYYY